MNEYDSLFFRYKFNSFKKYRYLLNTFVMHDIIISTLGKE